MDAKKNQEDEPRVCTNGYFNIWIMQSYANRTQEWKYADGCNQDRSGLMWEIKGVQKKASETSSWLYRKKIRSFQTSKTDHWYVVDGPVMAATNFQMIHMLLIQISIQKQ